MKIETRLRLGCGLNAREHHFARARRVKSERNAVGWLLRQFERPALPVTFTLTRLSPPSATGWIPLDRDNLIGACKAARDAIAEWMAVNDRDETLVRYEYRSEQGRWGLRIET